MNKKNVFFNQKGSHMSIRQVRRLKLFILVLIGVLFAKIFITLVSLPKITVDYVAAYNEYTKPVAFTAADNAADYYYQARRLYKELPEELYSSALLLKWRKDRTPFFEDINPDDLQLLEKWLQSNKPAFDQIKLAIQKPYAWFERKSETGNILHIIFEEFASIRGLSHALIYSAKVNAINNNFTGAANNITDCYQVGQHKCRENLSLAEQAHGLRIKNKATKAALAILAYSKPAAEELKYFQDSLQTIVDEDSYLPGFTAEKIFKYELVQRLYLDWIRGINRPAFRIMRQIICMCDDNNPMWVNAFTGPSRTEIISQIEHLFELHEQLRDKTPWQIHHQYSNLTSEIEAMNGDDFFGKFFATSYYWFFSKYYESKVQTDALITILAALRFKADNNRLPGTLDELVSKGYMKTVPHDPYSREDLVYQVIDNDFRLYSVGKDFEDNNGEATTVERDETFEFEGMDTYEMPAMPPASLPDPPAGKKTIWKVYKDIMYWPGERNGARYSLRGFRNN